MAATIQYFDGRNGRVLELGDEPVVVGQARYCTIRHKDKTLARRHAEIRRKSGRYLVTDLGSRTGTWINGERIESKELEHRDKIQCGSVELQYFDK